MRKKDLESTKLQTNEAFLNQNFLFYSTNEMKPRIIWHISPFKHHRHS